MKSRHPNKVKKGINLGNKVEYKNKIRTSFIFIVNLYIAVIQSKEINLNISSAVMNTRMTKLLH